MSSNELLSLVSIFFYCALWSQQLSLCFCQSDIDILGVLEKQGTAIAALEAQVAELQKPDCTCPVQDTIAFTVYMDYPAVKSVRNVVIPFQKVRTNVGGAFSTVANTFTVPKNGTYVFFAHLDCSIDYKAFQLRVNGITKGLAHNDVDDHSLSTYAILALTKGDKVNLVHDRPGGSLDGGEESIFAGFRLGN